MIPGQFNNRVLAERPNAARPDATHPPAPVFRPPHQTTKEESALMLEKLAAADGLSHASARAPPPAARIQELVDRVRVAEAAAAAQQARAVRAERERDDASRRLEDASRATWESDAGRLATDLAAANAEHARGQLSSRRPTERRQIHCIYLRWPVVVSSSRGKTSGRFQFELHRRGHAL